VHILTLNQDLDDLRKQIADRLNAGLASGASPRPVFIAACTHRSGTHYKRPRSTKYLPIGRAELWLSTWDDQGRCVERKSVDGEPTHDHYYYDLIEAQALHIVFPFSLKETAEARQTNSSARSIHPVFSDVGIRLGHSSGFDVVDLSPADKIPSELEPYIELRSAPGLGSRTGQKVPAIRFAKSEAIMVPTHRKATWHFGCRVPRFATLHPPGFYATTNVVSGSYFNNLVMCDSDPGPCVVCSGASNERRHLAVLIFGGDVMYPSNMICRGCARGSFDQMLALLDAPLLPALPA
jgi:hypothetical protein